MVVIVQCGLGEVSGCVGNGREYTLTWTDDSRTTVSSDLIFGAFTPANHVEPGDHVIASRDDHFEPGTVVSKADRNGQKLAVRFTDGSVTYVTLRLY